MIQVVKNIQVCGTGSQYAVRYAAKLHIQRAYHLTISNGGIASKCVRKMAKTSDIAGFGLISLEVAVSVRC
ncbi:Uncharacterised protein [Citrobacter koseri]|uniref:Uncharacterized protein n=1 Tax=Citrobacter koseri TaxID=545 RepID=A0A3S4ICU4_CITKO|nr:Uncharacterised protein [Citrobacter koseri]